VPDVPISELEARLVSASAEPVDPVKRSDALAELAWELRSGDEARAHALATEARDLAKEHGYTLGQARATRTLAMTIGQVDELRDVFLLAEEAKRLFDEADDSVGRAASRDFLASIHEFVGDFARGLDFALDALRIARELGDPIRQGYALSSVGGILAASGEVDAAVERLSEALSLFEGVGNEAGVGTICSRLAKVLKSAGRNGEALAYATRCRSVADARQDEFLLHSALTVMASLEDERDNFEEAERLYRSSIDALTNATARNVVGVHAQIALGRLLLRQGAIVPAEVELVDALSRVEDTISILLEATVHEAMAELREAQGELAKAIEHLRKAQALRERIAQQDARNKLAQVEVRAAMEAAEKDAEIHKLRFVELHGMQSKLVEAEKMALLGKLAAGTAHELHTPLAVLRSNADASATATERLVALVRDDAKIGAQAAKLASVLESCRETNDGSLERIAAIAHSLLRFTQLDQAERGLFDVRDGLDAALSLLEPTISKDVKLERRLDDVPNVEGSPRELNHAFMTVLQNATQAISGVGVVTVETSATPQHLLVRVRDTGRGMSDQEAAHLFDVAWGEDGTRIKMRLGLSAAYTTMQNHGGTLEVESAPGQGTTVTFRFPLP